MMDLKDKGMRRQIGKSCACFNLRRAARLVTQRFDLALRDSGITANQFSILMAAYNQAGILLTRMAKTLGMERTTLTRNVALLERRGMLLVKVGQDLRERRIDITRKGMALLAQALPLWQEAQNDVVHALGREKWEGLLSGLHEVARKLQ